MRALKARQVGGSFDTKAASALVAAKLANASLVEPLQHGDAMVGLTGLYATVNAIRLAVAHKRRLTDADVHLLLLAGFRYLSGRLTAAQVFQCGCRVSLCRGLIDAIAVTARQRLGVHVVAERVVIDCPDDRGAVFAAIEGAIMRWRPLLMQCRGGRYTVVSGFTPASLLLFDSSGARWIAKQACGVPGDCANARHMLVPGSLMALTA